MRLAASSIIFVGLRAEPRDLLIYPFRVGELIASAPNDWRCRRARSPLVRAVRQDEGDDVKQLKELEKETRELKRSRLSTSRSRPGMTSTGKLGRASPRRGAIRMLNDGLGQSEVPRAFRSV